MKFALLFFVACLLVGGCISCSESPSDIQRRGARHYNAGEFSQAVACFRKAAEKGDAEAQLNLGLCYENGRGVEKNNFEAAKWYRKSAEQGNVYAQINLYGVYFAAGNAREAMKWLRKAAEAGSVDAQLMLGVCYYNGEGVEKNAMEAVKWFRQAAEQGSSCGQIYLGMCYYNGEGVEKNAREAVKWFRKGIESKKEEGLIGKVVEKELGGTMQAVGYYFLGACYFIGKGVAVDKEKAKELWRKAEEQGSEDATEALRKCFNE